jgi:adenine-specific DNA-methyltransferase
MHNVQPFVTRFTPKKGKPMHILISDQSNRLLLLAKRYVLMKRFTSKEERRRLVAGLMEPTDSYSSFVGLENHLNYVYRADGELSQQEALGLTAIFNSAIIDCYFRVISGNTQVNAAEIRGLPFPDIKTIREIGIAVEHNRTSSQIERTVGKAIGLSKNLIKQLAELTVEQA